MKAVACPDEYVEPSAAPDARNGLAVTGRSGHVLPFDPTLSVPPAMSQQAVGADSEDVDAVGVTRGGRGLSAERAAEGLPLVPALAVPVPVPDLAVSVDGEDLGLAGLAPRRGGRSALERAAERGPVSRYLMRPCFLSQAAATALLSALSTDTCLFMSFSSACESFALIEFRSLLIVPSSF